MKIELRERFRARRREFSSQSGKVAAPLLNTHLRRLIGDLDDHGRAQICVYHAMNDEASVDREVGWFLPRLDGNDLQFRRPTTPDDLTTNRFGIAEPTVERSTALDESRPTIVCCPAVAVDWTGARLGMGKSFYDRYFTRHPRCLRIGVVYHVQTSEEPLPADEWDQPLDWIVSEKMILRTSKRSSPPWI